MINAKEELIRIIRHHIPHCKIMLFGSRARNTHKQGADYDIALDAGEKIAYETMLRIAGDIDESTIPVFVDVVDVHGVNEKFLLVIEKDFVVWI